MFVDLGLVWSVRLRWKSRLWFSDDRKVVEYAVSRLLSVWTSTMDQKGEWKFGNWQGMAEHYYRMRKSMYVMQGFF